MIITPTKALTPIHSNTPVPLTGRVIDPGDVMRLAMDTNMPGKHRRAANDMDFGDPGTYGLQLKTRKHADFDSMRFGIYLGPHQYTGWVVMEWDLFWEILCGHVYASLDALKQEWQLD